MFVKPSSAAIASILFLTAPRTKNGTSFLRASCASTCQSIGLTKLIMLTHSLLHVPDARHAFGEFNEVSSRKVHGFPSFGSDCYAPFENQASFLVLIGPGECACFATPDRPLLDSQLLNHV